jgi:hypothetical protein
MTKAIWVLIILVVGYGGFLLVKQWNQTQQDQAREEKKSAAAIVSGESLPGMPHQLETGLRTAKERGARAFQAWFKANEPLLADPRKAWIELELCVAMTRENPAEARKIFTSVQSRTGPSSPVWPRVQELAKTFE